MIIESGLLVAAGLLLTFWKAPYWIRIKMLSNPLMMDMLIMGFLLILHWGTFSGVMVASIGALVCSGMLSFGRWAFGYTKDGVYVPGNLSDMTNKLNA